SRWDTNVASKDRCQRAQCLAARSGALSHPTRLSSPYWGQMVHLSDVRLGPYPERLHRGYHPLGLHARVRSASAALRLDFAGAGIAAASSASIRIRPAQSYLYGDEQAKADPVS